MNKYDNGKVHVFLFKPGHIDIGKRNWRHGGVMIHANASFISSSKARKIAQRILRVADRLDVLKKNRK